MPQTHPLPPLRQRVGLFVVGDRGQGFVAFDFALGDQAVFFGADLFEEFAGGFVCRVLQDEFAAHGELEQGGIELVDGGGRGEELIPVRGEVLPVALEFVGIGRFSKLVERGFHPMSLHPRGMALLSFEPVAQGHEFLDLGDDAGLFGERGEWDEYSLEVSCCYPEASGALAISFYLAADSHGIFRSSAIFLAHSIAER
ncbi:hypothetical protein C0V76_19110 [Uliginosibacterium sp. TH139]|nr:hypothetical protein C0V76_19110 [Uliginosibacterium sp. TH139]